jgi:hypothetical protein
MGHLCKKPIQLNQETARSLCEPRRPAWVMDSRARPEHESRTAIGEQSAVSILSMPAGRTGGSLV